MLTQSQFDTVRKSHQSRLKTIRTTLTNSHTKVPLRRAASISATRAYHSARAVAKAFNQVARTQHKGYWPTPMSTKSAIENKYTATAIAILEFTSANKINLDRWMLAQVETLRKMRQPLTLFHCYGANAFKRYGDWEKRQGRTYKHSADRKKQTEVVAKLLRKTISNGHKQALKWRDALKIVSPPTLAAALMYIFPQIPAWYCIAYEDFRKDVLDSGFCNDPVLLECYKRYKRSEFIQEICQEALMNAIEKHGGVWCA